MASPTTLPGGVSPPGAAPSHLPHEYLERLVDQAAHFHVVAAPDPSSPPEMFSGGVRGAHSLHRFDIDLAPQLDPGVTAANSAGPPCGRLEYEWCMIPHDTLARPDRRPPVETFDPRVSQRFAMQAMRFAFDGGDGFRAFGTGRTFPVAPGGRPATVAAAVGNILEGHGRFRGREGNFTVCGSFSPAEGFTGHVMIRILDSGGELLTGERIPLAGGGPSPDREATYITYIGRKPSGAPNLENGFSFAADGSVRGLNIPVQLRRAAVSFDAREFRASRLSVGGIVGREIGFGKGSVAGAGPLGTPLDPFLFEGVSLYSFYDDAGRTVGAFTANVVEGRRFDVELPGAPGEQALRFGFFGPIVAGYGCFEGVQGFLYGASGSVFNLPPGDHVISNWYVARLLDPDGRFRAGVR